MTTTEIREDAIQRINQLPASKLKVAVEFLAFLEERGDDSATKELMRIPGLARDVRSARKQIETGKGTNWRDVRNDV